MKALPEIRRRRWGLGRAGFVLAALALVVSWVSGLGLLGGLFFGPFVLLLAGLWICIFSLRLRDIGWSIWFQVTPMTITAGLLGWFFVKAGEGQDQAYLVLVPSLQVIGATWLVFFSWLVVTPTASSTARTRTPAARADGFRGRTWGVSLWLGDGETRGRQFMVLTPIGRLGRCGFVLGLAGLLVVATALLWALPGFTYTVGGWLLFYLWVCLCSRRLHDMGWSAWVQLAPILATVGLAVVAFVLGLIYLAIVGVTDGLGGLPGLAIILLLTSAVWIAFIAWLAITPAKVENNPFGKTAPLPNG